MTAGTLTPSEPRPSLGEVMGRYKQCEIWFQMRWWPGWVTWFSGGLSISHLRHRPDSEEWPVHPPRKRR